MKETSKNKCAICSSVLEFLYSINRFEKNFDIEKCPECNLQMQSNLCQNASVFYNEDYYIGKSEYSYRDERKQEKYDNYVHNARLETIAKFIKPPSDFLDIGCAFGGFVKAASEFGYRAQGLDVSSYAANAGQKRGLKIHSGELTLQTFPKDSFDVVTLIEVIEHITNPNYYLKCLEKIIRPGGLLVLQTANFEGKQAINAGSSYHYYLPGHYFYYSLGNLQRLLTQFGFSNFRPFIPVDFSLIAKLKKSSGSFRSIFEYWKWIRIALYHWKSKIRWKGVPQTSSMVLYAFKK